MSPSFASPGPGGMTPAFNWRAGARAVTAAVLAVVVLAACSGEGDGTSPTTRRANSSTTTAMDGRVPSPGVTTTAVPAGGASSPGAGTTKVPSDGSASSRGRPTTTSPSRAASAAPAVATTPPGRYRYASTGTFSAGVTGEQVRSGESVLTVDPPVGADQHSLRQGDGRSSEQVVRFQADGIYIVMLKVTEQGLTKEFRPPAPVLAFPYGAAVGRTWSWRMTSVDGKTTVDSELRIERTETVQVGAESVPAVVVQANLVTSGDLVSRGTQALWVNEPRRLVVREHSETNGTFGAISFRSTSKENLLDIFPL